VVGIMNGFLPCGLVYAALAAAAARGSAGEAMLGMMVFGLGTWPALGALGIAGSALGPGVRARLRPAAALLMLALAGVSFWRAHVSPTVPCHTQTSAAEVQVEATPRSAGSCSGLAPGQALRFG
jgi:sulfite exporter TauE/SafE